MNIGPPDWEKLCVSQETRNSPQTREEPMPAHSQLKYNRLSQSPVSLSHLLNLPAVGPTVCPQWNVSFLRCLPFAFIFHLVGALPFLAYSTANPQKFNNPITNRFL